MINQSRGIIEPEKVDTVLVCTNDDGNTLGMGQRALGSLKIYKVDPTHYGHQTPAGFQKEQ